MSKQVFYGYFEGGKLRCEAFVSWLREPGRRAVKITAQDDKPTRSSQQNRYYHGVVVREIGLGLAAMGWEPRECRHDTVHDMLKRRFLSEDRPLGSDGEYVTIVRSTTDLDTTEFGAYVDHCVRFAAEYLGVMVPAPGESN